MPLVQDLNKTIEAMIAINNGDDQKAASIVGLTCNTEVVGDSFLERVAQVAGNGDMGEHTGGLLVTPDSKTINSKELVADAMELPYALAESVTLIVAKNLAVLSRLNEAEDEPMDDIDEDDLGGEEGEGEEQSSGVKIGDEEMDNIKDTMDEGLYVIKETLIDIFANTAKLNISAQHLFTSALQNPDAKARYIPLVANAITGAGILYAIDKICEYRDSNRDDIQEAIDPYNALNVHQFADRILCSTLNLEESLINTYANMATFNNRVIAMLEGVEMPSGRDSLGDASEFLSVAVEQIASPLSNMDLDSVDVSTVFDKAIEALASLYDEYLQDSCVK